MARILGAVLVSIAAAAAGPLYNESADAHGEVDAALATSKAERKPLLIVFGANWCPDCRALDSAMGRGDIARFTSSRFKVVKVDVGNFDRNLDIAARFGNPAKQGIPAAVVVSPDGQVVYSTRRGELSSARSLGDAGILTVLQAAAAAAKR
ncbi:MAG: thioredoxin family protein [Ideonella sp.]|nr:thioredoxin family protein [Ideonella sp.]